MRVFLSSTARDLQEYRDAVFAAIQACDDLHCVRMEDFGARAEMADEFCRAKVAECDVFVGIVGHYFGSSPAGSDKSYTQQEYDAAVETNRPRLMFIAPDDFPIPASLVENASKRKRQRELRARVNGLLRAEFKSPQDLATKVVTAIHNWEREQEQISMEQLRAQYLTHVIGEWEKIRLIGFSHAGKVVDDPKLEQVFVPLRVESIASREPFENEGEITERERTRFEELPLPRAKLAEKLDVSTRELSHTSSIYLVRAELPEKVDVNTALQFAQKAVVLGAPGAGKSTLLQWLALSFARGWHGAATVSVHDESRVPLRIVLREFARERSQRGAGYAVEDYLHEYYHARGQNFPPQFFCRFIERGQCALLFDGMDEVGTAAQRIEMRDLIENLARAHPANRFIVTSRPKGYEAAPLDRREFCTFSILEFDDDAIRQFIENWYRAVEGKNEPEAKEGARLLSESLDANPNVKRLAVNPLMLTIIATIHRTERLPNQRVRLYDKCTESLLVKWDEVRGIGSAPIGEEEQRRRLEHIAYWMHSENIGDVERDELSRKLTRFLKPRYPDAADEASRFIDRLVERAGILVERSPDRFAFVHRTFQEYFAAMDIYNRYLDEEDPQIVHDAVMSHLHDPRWEEVSLLTMAKLKIKPATKLLQAILSANSWGEDILHRDLFFAARVLADDVMVERAVAEQVVKGLCAGLLNTHGRDSPHKNYTEILTRIVRSEHGDIATVALRNLYKKFLDVGCNDWMKLLAASKEPEAAQLLLDLARTASNEWVRRAAALALLGEFEDWGFFTVRGLRLMYAVKADGVRWYAAPDLGEIGEKSEVVINRLLDLAHTAGDEGKQLDGAEALGKLGEKAQAVQVLLDLAHTANDEGVRWAAAQVLGELGEKEQAVQLLLGLARAASDERKQLDAVKSLVELGEKAQAIELLLGIARTACDEQRKLEIATELVKLGEKIQSAQLLLDLTRRASSEWMCRNAVRQLVGLGTTAQVVPPLLDLARTATDEWEKLYAAETLGELGETAQAVPPLLDLARTSTDEKVRRNAARALGKLGEEAQAAQLLLELGRTASDGGGKRFAAESLGELGKKAQAVPLLLDVARTAHNERDRLDAAKTLIEWGEKTQVMPLIFDLASTARVEGVRRIAASTLGELGENAQAVTLLLDLARTASDEDVRRNAVWALGELNETPQVAQVLLDLAHTANDEKVRQRATEALGELGEKVQNVLDGLLDLARQDESADVRDAAYGALKALMTDSTNVERINE